MNAATWKAPVLIALASAVGLVSALLADGFWDVLSWIGLGIPMMVIGWYWWRPPGRQPSRG